MNYKIHIIFINGKDLAIVLKEEEFNKFLQDMERNRPYWNEDMKSGFAVPLFNVMYYTFGEYTEEMKKADEDRVKQSQEAALKQEEVKTDEVQ